MSMYSAKTMPATDVDALVAGYTASWREACHVRNVHRGPDTIKPDTRNLAATRIGFGVGWNRGRKGAAHPRPATARSFNSEQIRGKHKSGRGARELHNS